MPLPTDVNDSPNYDPDDHAAHHNEIHTFVNAGGGGGGSGTGFTETSPDVWEFTPAGGTSIDVMTTVAGSAINITAAGAGSDVNVTGVGTVYLSGGGGDATLELSAAEAVLTCSNDAAVVALGGTLTFVDNTGIITLDQIRSGLIVTANRQTGNYTLVLADVRKVIEMNVAGANTLTVPPNSSVAFPIGTVIEGVQWGAGQTTITPGVGVTIRSSGGKLKTAAQYATFSLRKVAADEWHVTGELSA